ncbi:MAG: LysR family transcriptional regulator [Clostridia bacterium]|nr:LysR family transcriptional regulator [Clostridia bacterium]
MNFRIEQYRIFNVVAKSESFSKAAKALFMTQSAVSQAIKQLETSIDMTLFKRTSKGVELTEAGNILYKYTSSAMELLETGLFRVEALKTLDDGELKIGASDTISTHFLLPRLEMFHKLYPNIKIKVINRVTTETIELLKNGQIDIAFGNLPIEDENLEVIECMTVHDTFVAGNDYKEYKEKVFTHEDISKLPLILLENKSNSRKYVDKIFLESGQVLTPSIELGAHELLLQLAKINLGISCVVREFSEEYLKNDFVFELKQKNPIPERAIGYCYSKSLHLTPTMKEFMTFLNSGSLC